MSTAASHLNVPTGDARVLHVQPPLTAVLLENLRATGRSLRPVLIALAVLWLVFDIFMSALAWQAAAHALPDNPRLGARITLGFAVEESIIAGLMSLLLALILWLDESPSKRTYHWMMPVDRRLHALLKVAAGWFWVMLAVASFVVNTLFITAVTAAIQHFNVLLAPASHVWFYVVPFTAGTIGYLLASSACVGSRTPIIWVAGPPLLLIGIIALATEYRVAWLMKLHLIVDGHYGLLMTLGWGLDGTSDPAGQLIGDPLARWLETFALWLGVSALLLFLSSRIRREVK